MESIDDLQAQLAATNDEAEQAGLLDAIGIQLTHQNRPLDALEYSSRALEIRQRLADRDVNAELRLASSLFNRGAHLRVLKRHDEAVMPYAASLQIRRRHLADTSPDKEMYVRAARALADVLAELQCYDMAARFQGTVVDGLLEWGTDPSEQDDELRALTVHLDSLDSDVPTRRLELSTDTGLLALSRASLATALRMEERATRHHGQGELMDAIGWAIRTVRYCDLFAGQDERFAALSNQNLGRVADWSAAAHFDSGMSCLAGLRGVVTGQDHDATDRGAGTSDARIASESTSADRRLWCCSVRDLLLLIADLGRAGIPASDVHALAGHFREKGIYPARDYSHRCQSRPPDIFITYDWRQNFVGLYDLIAGVMVYMGQAVRQARDDLDSSRIRHLVFDEVGLWIDFVFVDQSARDLGAEVREIIPRVIDAADVHLVLSKTALIRSWCCYELALFNKRQITDAATLEVGGHIARPLRSFVTQDQAHGFGGFAQTATTAPEDKEAIEAYLSKDFPGGVAGVDLLLVQAGWLDKRVTPQFAVPPAAEATMLAAADKWLTR